MELLEDMALLEDSIVDSIEDSIVMWLINCDCLIVMFNVIEHSNVIFMYLASFQNYWFLRLFFTVDFLVL